MIVGTGIDIAEVPRIRAAIERKKADGTWVGRGKDKDERKRSGYFAREARKRERA